jgi:hypothetical protein
MRFERLYGERPLHLLASVASLAVAGYGVGRIFDTSAAVEILIWIAASAFAHDLIALPLYSALGMLAGGVARLGLIERADVSALNHVRVPVVLSGLMLVVFFPLILGLSGGRYERAAGLELDGYIGRWLLITGVLFAASALAYATRLRRARS